jgi:hypothetical protein
VSESPRLASLAAQQLAVIDLLAPDLWRKCDVARKNAALWPRDIVLPSWAAPHLSPLRLRPEDPDDQRVSGFNIAGYAAVYADLLARGYRPEDRVLTLSAQRLAMFFSWRATKLEFRFDADFAAELMRTPLSGEIPATILRRLPASCVFVALPGGVLPGVDGFYAGLDQRSRNEIPVLSLWSARPDAWPTHTIDLVLAEGVSLEAAAKQKEASTQHSLEELLAEAKDSEAEAKAAIFDRHRVEWAKNRAETVGKMLSCLLFLCSEEPDLPDTYAAPSRQEKVVGTQRRIIPPKDVIGWPVGVRLGAVFRKTNEPSDQGCVADETGTPHIVRPHIRRAHWHTYWLGPKGSQKPSLRWLSPILVGTPAAGETVPTVVRPVSAG